MDGLISRSALLNIVEPRLDYLRDKNGPYDHYTDGYEECYDRIDEAPIVDAVEAIKSTEEIEQALSILNIYRNSYYAEPSGTVKYAVANAINTILPLFVKCLCRQRGMNDVDLQVLR